MPVIETLTTKTLDAIQEFADRIAPVYALLQWKWAVRGGVYDPNSHEVPDAGEIAATLAMLARDAKKSQGGCVRTGGLSVFYQDGDIYLQFTKSEHFDDSEDCPARFKSDDPVLEVLKLAEEAMTNAYDVEEPLDPSSNAGIALTRTRALIAELQEEQ